MATRHSSEYDHRREALATYFDSTARQAWIDLTSDAKVSGIRATVRAGRDAMRANLLDWLPTDLRRTKVLDAGCGTGSLAVAAACRGAEVTGIDVAAGLVEVARERTPSFIGHGRIHWRSGDMLDPQLGTFAHVVAMDSLIHYDDGDILGVLRAWSQRSRHIVKSGNIFVVSYHNKKISFISQICSKFDVGCVIANSPCHSKGLLTITMYF